MRPLKKLSGRFALPQRNTLRGAFHLLIWEGSFASAFSVFTSGGLLIGLAIYLHASNWQISLLNSMVYLVMPFQTLLGVYFNKPHIRKKSTLISAVLFRIIWLVPMALVWWKPTHAIYWLLLFVFLQNVMMTVSALCWLSWMGDLIVVDLRGRFFGARQRGASIANVIFLMSGGYVLDHMRALGKEGSGHLINGTIAIIVGFLSVLLLSKVPRTIRKATAVITSEEDVISPWRDPVFRKIMIGFGGWYAAVGVGSAYWAVHMLTHLKFGYTMLAGYGTGFTIVMAFMSPYAGKWVDKYGDFGITTVGMMCLASVPVYWLFITAAFPYVIILEILITAIGWSTIQLTTSTIPLRYSTPHNRNKYLAALSLVIGICFTVGSIVGGVLMDEWDAARGVLFGIQMYPTHFIFALTGLLRWITAIYFFRLEKEMQPITLQ